MIKCSRSLKIWLTDSKYGVILQELPALMRCPYPEKLKNIDGKYLERQEINLNQLFKKENSRQRKLKSHLQNLLATEEKKQTYARKDNGKER